MSKKEEFSKKNNNLEIVSSDEKKEINKSENKNLFQDKPGNKNIFIGTLNLFTQPLKERHEKHYKESNFHLFADITLVFIIFSLFAIFIGFYFWTPKQEIELKITNSKTVLSGKQETFTFSYAHRGDRNIDDSVLAVNLPENFLFQKAVPENIYDSNKNTFNLGKLSSGANGELKIIGIVLGEPGSRQIISSSFNYKLEGKDMRELNSFAYNIEGSSLNISWDIPGQVYKNNNFKGELTLSNKSDLNQNQIIIQLSPSHWDLNQVYGSGDYEWDDQLIKINNLAKGESSVLNFDISTDLEEGDYNLEAVFSTLNNGLKIKQFEKTNQVKVIKPSFKININPDRKAFKLNDKITFDVDFTNLEKEEIDNLGFKVRSFNSDFSLSDFNIINKDDYTRSEDNIELGELASNESESFKILTDWTRNEVKSNQVLGIIIDLEYDFLGQRVNLSSFSPVIKLLSQLNVSSAGYYYSPQGDQLGVGPLPPKVGIPTSYWVFWELDNFGNDLSQVTVSADLPEGVTWMDDKSLLAGNLMYGDIGGKVVWELKKVDSLGGEYKAGFRLSVAPEEGDIGKILNLLENVKYSAYDNFCDEKIEEKLDDISTDLKNDELAKDQGQVVR